MRKKAKNSTCTFWCGTDAEDLEGLFDKIKNQIFSNIDRLLKK